jgi:hypothetical protein
MKTVNLNVQSNSLSIWSCPNRPSLPNYSTTYGQWNIGYQYLGGIILWYNPAGQFPSLSPVKLGLSKPHWVLAADAVVETENGWGGSTTTDPELYVNLPPHRNGASSLPVGGNEVFADGSARWIKAEQMRFLTTWNLTDRKCYFYQDSMDFPTTLLTQLDRLYMKPQ